MDALDADTTRCAYERSFENIPEPMRKTLTYDRYRAINSVDTTDRALGALSLDDTLNFVRGFMLFSLLANLAEDRQGLAHENGASVEEARAQLQNEGVTDAAMLEMLSASLTVPVLTAHPTRCGAKVSSIIKTVLPH
jgi:phosphoenolpyruvate carboxylase